MSPAPVTRSATVSAEGIKLRRSTPSCSSQTVKKECGTPSSVTAIKAHDHRPGVLPALQPDAAKAGEGRLEPGIAGKGELVDGEGIVGKAGRVKGPGQGEAVGRVPQAPRLAVGGPEGKAGARC